MRTPISGRYGEKHDTIFRLGFSTLARLWRKHGGGDGPAVRSAWLQRARQLPRAEIANSPDRWYFCMNHAGEYNRGWNYFEGLSAEEAAEREAAETRTADGYADPKHYAWAGSGDGSRSRDERHALTALELEDDADFEAVKKAWRRLAKENHPDVKPNDAMAAVRFQSVQAAYEVLRAAEERRPR